MALKPREELLPSENRVREKLKVPWKYIYPCDHGDPSFQMPDLLLRLREEASNQILGGPNY